ncbi:MAG: adenosylcobalamin-dependent ribonucleoside-diphosphate reductase [Armatimonadota bacterium]
MEGGSSSSILQQTTSDLHPETLAAFDGDELRARVFHDKYALRDADGRVVERTPDQMWRRIASELASVEAPELREQWKANFEWLLTDFRLIPGGRIMHGAGNPKRVTLLNCFPAGTPVLSKRGFLPIEQILPGDEVLTHRDRFSLVTHVIETKIEEPLVELSCFYLGDQPIRCTADHRFLALDRDGRVGWTPARELTRDHYIRVGRAAETIPLEELDVSDYLEGGALEDDEGHVFLARPYVGGQGAVGVAESRRVKRHIAVNEDFGRWLGYFIAEGGVTDNSVYFTLSRDEGRIAAEIAALTQRVFGVDASIQTRTGQPSHWIRVYAHSKLLVRFVRSFFNSRVHSTDKLLPHWFLRVLPRVQKAFLGAVFAGDGVVLEKSVKLFLANPDLIRQIYAIMLRLNIVASIRWEGKLRLTRHRGMWIHVGTQPYVKAVKAWIRGDLGVESTLTEVYGNYFYKVVDGALFVKVKRLLHTEAAAQTVFDLTVEDDHSFTAGWLGAHNCYVIPVKDDSIESIFEWTKEAARTYSLGGGVGTDISVLRPRGAPVNNAARSSTGSVSFMELFSLTTGTIGQSGRRGALMITIADNHPDVLDFIKVKRNLNKVRYANISVRISDAFMRAVEEDGTWDLAFDNDRASLRRTVRARDVWRELIKGARDYAEPGVIFWDTVKRWSTSEYNGMEVITTNPCSEIPLEKYGVCDLANVCLSKFVQDEFTSQARIDWDRLERALQLTVRFLDNVLDYNAEKHPLPEQRKASLYSRRIGVGFTALGDMLIKLGLKYDTDGAVAFVDGLFDRIKNIVYDASVNLAIEKGTFPGYDAQAHLASPFIQTLSPKVRERIGRHGLRNVAVLTVPPVGSGAALAGVTSGIEPIFDVSYIRRSESLSQEIFTVYHPLVREYMTRFGVDRQEDLPEAFVTAHQISADMRVRMQAAIQRHIDHSISSTVNLPQDTSPEEVERIYLQAWKHGLKGITVYRESSREGILITESQAKAQTAAGQATDGQPVVGTQAADAGERVNAGVAAPAHGRVTPRPRPKVTSGRTERIETPRGRVYVVINEDELGICEVFVHSLDVEAEAIGRMASLALRGGLDARDIIEQLWRVQSKELAFDRSADGTVVRVTTIAQAVALALGRTLYGDAFRPDKAFPRADALPEPGPRARQEGLRFAPPPAPTDAGQRVLAPVVGGNGDAGPADTALIFVGICPDCGASLVHENGCATCRQCGYSRC